ncbi:MAG: hypothetical protein ACI4LH_08080 [Candidatus Heritagella sp.]
MESVKKSRTAFDYVVLGLYAFCALEIEFLLILLVEPYVFSSISDPTLYCCLHWGLSALLQAGAAAGLWLIAKNSYAFDLFSYRTSPQRRFLLIALGLCLLGIGYNYLTCGEWLLAYKLRVLTPVEFIFQYLVYLVRAALMLLLIAFGQKAGEIKKHGSRAPWGGFLAGALWGLFQMLTVQDLLTGILSCVVCVVYGVVYLLVNKNVRYAYPLLVLMIGL